MEAGDLPDSAEKRFVYTISIINGKARQMRQQKFMNDFDAAKLPLKHIWMSMTVRMIRFI